MNRFVVPVSLAIVLTAAGAPPEQGQLDASPTLFTVMAAINAAGYYADASSPNNSPLREQVRSEILKKNPPCLKDLKQFFQDHRKRGLDTETAELAQYISFALSAGGPPNFEFTQRDVDIPPDVVPLKQLSPLLARFYREADIPDLWKRAQPAIDQYITRVHQPISDAVLQANAYLRNIASTMDRSRFQIDVELLAAPNQVQARSYADVFTVVLTPSPVLRTFDIRHEYLHYLLDPLATGQREVLNRKQPIAEHTLRAPALEPQFKEDFLLLTTECLIKAIEARLDRKPEAVQKALREGFILTPYFSEQLPAYEKQELPMKSYFAEMAKAIDLAKEDRRLTGIEFEKQPAPRELVRTAAPPPPPLTGAAKTLDEAETLYEARGADPANLEKAKSRYLDVLQASGAARSTQAAAYYGLGRIAALQRDPAAAEQLFQKTLESQPEPQVKGWTLVYLGRLALAAGDRDAADKNFQEALKVDGASDAAKKAATEGLQRNNPE